MSRIALVVGRTAMAGCSVNRAEDQFFASESEIYSAPAQMADADVPATEQALLAKRRLSSMARELSIILRITLFALSLFGIARAEMVRNDAIGNDPAKEKLCFELVKAGSFTRAPLVVTGGPIPFEIDTTYLKNQRLLAEDVTFIAVLTKPEDGNSSLVQCANQNRRGFDVANRTIGEYSYWRLLRNPPARMPTTNRPTNGCWSIGDTVTVVGRAGGGRALVPLEPFCVHYPTPAKNLPITSLQTVDSASLPGRIYVELTAEIVDGFPYNFPDVAIKVSSVRDVDDEVHTFLSKAKGDCEGWQRDNSVGLTQQTHGGSVVQVWNFDHIDWDPTGIPHHVRQCGIWAIDTMPPHGRIDIWRPDPSKPFSLPPTMDGIGGR